MPNDLQNFFASATQKAADELIAAVENLPEDKRSWSPFDKGRTALDQTAECALLNGTTAGILESHIFTRNYDFDEFLRVKTELAQDWNNVKKLLQENTAKFIAVIRATPDDALNVEVEMPWGKMTLTEIMSYPYWNMTYHQGQTNYINFIK